MTYNCTDGLLVGPFRFICGLVICIAKKTCVKESTIVIANTSKIFQRCTSLCQFVGRVISEGLHVIRLHDGILSLREEIWDDKTNLTPPLFI